MVLVLAFGSPNDPQAWEMSDVLKRELPHIKFVKAGRPDDVLGTKRDIVILDVVKDISNVRQLTIDDLKKRKLVTVHDFDLGYFLLLMKESGRLRDVRIIGIPDKWDSATVREVKRLLTS